MPRIRADRIEVEYNQEEESWIAWDKARIPTHRGILGYGATEDEAREDLVTKLEKMFSGAKIKINDNLEDYVVLTGRKD